METSILINTTDISILQNNVDYEIREIHAMQSNFTVSFHFALNNDYPMPALFAMYGNMRFLVNVRPDSLADQPEGFKACFRWDLRARPLEVL